jgi:hypothetical protein
MGSSASTTSDASGTLEQNNEGTNVGPSMQHGSVNELAALSALTGTAQLYLSDQNKSAYYTTSQRMSFEERPYARNQSIIPPDGYKWRKYGQKQVKGQIYPRSYYKCTTAGCSAKKYVEQEEQDGKLVDKIAYRGEHNHDASRVTHLNAADQLSFKSTVLAESTTSDKLENEQEHEIEVPVQEPSISIGTVMGESSIPQSNGNRLVVETTADVDHLDDGYHWRKYGQKYVKGSPNPRSYYRCTEELCSVKKQVERKGNTIITSYEGTHTHPAPGIHESKKKKRKPRKSIDVGSVDEYDIEDNVDSKRLREDDTGVMLLHLSDTPRISTTENGSPVSSVSQLNESREELSLHELSSYDNQQVSQDVGTELNLQQTKESEPYNNGETN